MLSFLLAPAMSFFSIRLYREFLRSGIGRGLVYLLYVTFLAAVIIFFLCKFILLPVTSDFLNWFVQVTPEMTLSESGVSTSVHQPYLVKHPTLGPLYLIDTTKNFDELVADESKAMVVIGKEKVIIRNPYRKETRIFDLKQAIGQPQNPPQPLHVTKSLMRELANRLEKLVIPVVLLVLAPLFFIWKLVIAVFYFLIALLLNLFRKEKFSPRSLFALSCLAITPVTLIQMVHISIPDLYFNLNFYFAFALTVSYLVYGMFVASRSSDQAR